MAEYYRKKLPLSVKIKYLIKPPGWSHDGSSKTAKQLRKELFYSEQSKKYSEKSYIDP
jgi:hypothetical protein